MVHIPIGLTIIRALFPISKAKGMLGANHNWLSKLAQKISRPGLILPFELAVRVHASASSAVRLRPPFVASEVFIDILSSGHRYVKIIRVNCTCQLKFTKFFELRVGVACVLHFPINFYAYSKSEREIPIHLHVLSLCITGYSI